MKPLQLLLCLGVITWMFSCQGSAKKETSSGPFKDSVLLSAKNIFQPLPIQADNPENPITPEKVVLGKQLYFDARLSMKGNESCNTCHNLATFGVDNKPTSPGDNGKNGSRNSPPTLNAALHFVQFWDGRMKTVEEQAGGPVMNPAEMNMPSEKIVTERLMGSEGYKKLFAAAFPGQKTPVTFENMRLAIAAYERTLITPGRFDKFVTGDTSALNPQEVNGLKLFMETGCTACHSGPLLGGNMFQKYPLFGNHKELTGSTTDDPGRMSATKNEADKYFYKVPSLRNIAETSPYLHDGSVAELPATVKIMAKGQLNKDYSPQQQADIVAFLKALTGELPAGTDTPPTPLN